MIYPFNQRVNLFSIVMIVKKITIRFIFLLCISGVSVIGFSQNNTPAPVLSDSELEKVINNLLELTEKGVEITEDSLIIGEEFRKMLNDEAYRSSVFPEKYTWEQTKNFIQQQELKRAFWYMINLYSESPEDKEIVVRSLIFYDNLLKMDKVLVNTFYTYCYFDPEVGEVIEGVPEILRPDILEVKLNNVKEIVGYIRYYRENKAEPLKN